MVYLVWVFVLDKDDEFIMFPVITAMLDGIMGWMMLGTLLGI